MACTYAILEGLARAGDHKDDKVYLVSLADYVKTRVPEISRELKACTVTKQQEYCQKPQMPVFRDNYPLVPRYPQILARLGTTETAIPTQPTHVVIQAAEVFPQAARGTGPSGSLAAGDQVSVVKSEGGWAQIAQRGRLLGFVQQDRLLKLINP